MLVADSGDVPLIRVLHVVEDNLLHVDSLGLTIIVGSTGCNSSTAGQQQQKEHYVPKQSHQAPFKILFFKLSTYTFSTTSNTRQYMRKFTSTPVTCSRKMKHIASKEHNDNTNFKDVIADYYPSNFFMSSTGGGSRIDILLPENAELLVGIGDRVVGTQTPIARIGDFGVEDKDE